MSFDLFTLDVATACPAEFELMQKVGDAWRMPVPSAIGRRNER